MWTPHFRQIHILPKLRLPYPSQQGSTRTARRPSRDSQDLKKLPISNHLLSEMSDKAVEAALKPEQTSTSTQSSSDVTDQSGGHDDKETEASTAVPNVTDGLNVDNEDVASSVADALAEYEATLSKPITHERNERNKLILYLLCCLPCCSSSEAATTMPRAITCNRWTKWNVSLSKKSLRKKRQSPTLMIPPPQPLTTPSIALL